jgi:hypothetical protein
LLPGYHLLKDTVSDTIVYQGFHNLDVCFKTRREHFRIGKANFNYLKQINMIETQQTISLIIGCGHLGSRVLSELESKGIQAWATSRKQVNAELIKNPETHLLLDINNRETWKNLLPLTTAEIDVYFLLPPSQIELACLQDFVTLLGIWKIRRLVMSSSTVVYGSQSRLVDADSEVNIDTDRAERQYSIEQNIRSSGIELKIVRLAGLYASDRIIGKQAILDGQTLSGKGDSWLNLIHTTDAANLLIEVMASETASSIEMGSDGNPVRRANYYGDLADHYSREPPVFRNEETERGEGRRCDNSITVERTAWRAAITDYRKGWLI